jgi:hypothetical protein
MHRTAEQARGDNIAAMGRDVGEAYSALWQEVAWIHKKWNQYVALFGASSDRIDLLNRAAPSLFRTVQDTLWDDVLLHLARLTDSPRSMGRSNLSLRHFEEVVANEPIASTVRSLADAAHNASTFARDWRNRRLAHRDLELALGQPVQPLAPASRADIKSAMSALTALLDAVSQYYLGSTNMFDFGPDRADALALLYIIRDGLEFEAQRKKLINRGDLPLSTLTANPL